jgi:pimeloyl-ACP methyl ester carboxylesterase
MPTIKTQTGTLAYFDSAPGSSDKPIVVLLHSSASAALQWRKLIGEIAIRYRVVAPDLIG